MIISEVPPADTQNAEFVAAIKLICRCEEIPTAEIVVQKADEYEQFGVRNLNYLAKRKRVDLFFCDLYTASWLFDEYEKIKKGGITFTDIESNEIYNMLNVDKSIVIDEFLTRSFDYAYREAQKFKTKDGRNNCMKRYFESLKSHEGQLCSENIQRLKALEMMIEMNGVEPKSTLKPKK